MTIVHLLAAALALFAHEMSDPAAGRARDYAVAGAEELSRLKNALPRPAINAVLLNWDQLTGAMKYPDESIEKEEEGTAHAWLLVGTDGRVERCGMAFSSGSSGLDIETCQLLVMIARFRPAQDAQGNPIKSLFHQAITWELEDEPSPSILASPEELDRLKKELRKPAKYAKLLNPTSLASAMDYPREALRNEEEGRATAWLLIGTDGRVERCGIQSSSGSKSLDEQTCNLLLAKANFQPARDRRGRPVQSIFYQPLTWRLQDGPGMDLKDLATKLRFIVGTEANVRSCKAEILFDQKWVEAPQELCEQSLKHGKGILAFARQRSKLYEALIVSETWVVVTPGHTIPSVGRQPGEVLIFLRSGSASYSAEGKRISCTKGESVGFEGYMDDVCEPHRASGLLLEMPKPPGRPIEKMQIMWAIYLKDEPT